MARTRRKVESTDGAETTPDVEANQNTTNKERTFMALTPDEIRAIYANRRQKGLYDRLLTEFLESNEMGTSVKEQWPEVADKKAASLKQGFDNAKGRKEAPEGSEAVDVIVDGDNVFLINKVLAGVESETVESVA